MAAARLFQVCVRVLPKYYSVVKPNYLEKHVGKVPSLSSVRDYRGSNRDTRRRERNRQAKLRRREGTRLSVFDKKEFMSQNYEKELFAFKSRLQLHFQDEATLLAALTHTSYEPDESEDYLGSRGQPNPKLALLGHSFISRHVTEYLFFKFPSLPVDGLRNLCNFLTSREIIVKIAEEIGMPDLIRIEHDLEAINEEKHLALRREDVISDAFLSLVAAIYIDQGFKEAGEFVQDFVIPQMNGEELVSLLKFEKPQTLLENLLQASGKEKPVARLIRESGRRTHLPVFVVAVYSGEEVLAEAASWNVEKAKHEAMTAAVIKYVLRETQSEPNLPSMKDNRSFNLA